MDDIYNREIWGDPQYKDRWKMISRYLGRMAIWLSSFSVIAVKYKDGGYNDDNGNDFLVK